MTSLGSHEFIFHDARLQSENQTYYAAHYITLDELAQKYFNVKV